MTRSLRLSFAAFGLAILLAGCAAEPRRAAQSQTCPAWVDYPADPHSNKGSVWLGCANRENLKAMLDNKHDLATGRSLGPADGERESSAVEAYEAGKTKAPTAGAQASGSAVLLQPSGAAGTQQ